MARRLLTAFCIGVVMHGFLRVFLSLAVLALVFYGFDFALELALYGRTDLVTLAIIGLSTVPTTLLVGYYAREWGWVLSALVGPAWTVCIFPFGPIIQNLLSLAFGFDPVLEGYFDWSGLIFLQLVPGVTLGCFCGLAGELLGLVVRRRRKECSPADAKAGDYARIADLRDLLRWYFPKSPWILVRVPVLLLFGGLAIVTAVLNLRHLLELGPVSTVAFLQILFIGSPALILPYLWSSSVSLPRSSRLGLSIVLVPVWIALFLILGHLRLL